VGRKESTFVQRHPLFLCLVAIAVFFLVGAIVKTFVSGGQGPQPYGKEAESAFLGVAGVRFPQEADASLLLVGRGTCRRLEAGERPGRVRLSVIGQSTPTGVDAVSAAALTNYVMSSAVLTLCPNYLGAWQASGG
jgi:hypothetical protein